MRPILALHGWQDNLGTFDRLVPFFPKHIAILCVDFPGHGRSSPYPYGMTYHMIDYVDTIKRVMAEYKWEKVSLLGHSLGGIVSFIYAALFPQTVDMLIQLDIIITPLRSPEYKLKKLLMGIEKAQVENERLKELKIKEAPSYTYEEMEEKLHLGSNKSIEKENCKYILNRSVNASQLNPGKYYFSRDGRIKYYHEFNPSMDLIREMNKRIRNIKYMLIKFKNSDYVEEEMLKIVREIHTNMEVYEVEGSHHAHLNNPKEVAELLIPFILKNTANMKQNEDIKSKL